VICDVIRLLTVEKTAVDDSPDAVLPVAYMIPDVPYHRQLTRFSCGAASLEMVLNYYGADVNQYSIMDVARTSVNVGGLCYLLFPCSFLLVFFSTHHCLSPSLSLSLLFLFPFSSLSLLFLLFRVL